MDFSAIINRWLLRRNTLLYLIIFLFGYTIGGMSLFSRVWRPHHPHKHIVKHKADNQISPMFFNDSYDPFSYPQIAAENSEISKTLHSSVKVLCLINTAKHQLSNRAIHINATWARRCDKHLFLSYNEKIDLPYLDLKQRDSRYNLWNKIRAMFQWVYENEIDNYDFFFKVDDDSYVIMENLKLMLMPYNPDKAYYFGCRFKKLARNGYMSGGSGYVLSREAVRQIVPNLYNAEVCPQKNENKEDAKIGICVENLNITTVDTRDNMGRHRMLPFEPKYHFRKGLVQIHFDYLYYPYFQTRPFESFSEHMISFHYITKEMLYIFELLIYHVNPIAYADKVWLNVLKESKGQNSTVMEMLRSAALKLEFNSSVPAL